MRIVGAGCAAPGNDIDRRRGAGDGHAGGAAGFAAIVTELLTATFGHAAERVQRPNPPTPQPAPPRRFHGMTSWPIGFGLLRLSPKTFWSMTPRELERAVSGCVTGSGVARRRGAELAALMQRSFPTLDLRRSDMPEDVVVSIEADAAPFEATMRQLEGCRAASARS